MTYAARDDTTLPKLLAQMRWVVLVDKRQLAVLLLENEDRSLPRRTLDTRGDSDYENQPVDAVERLCRRLADQAVRQWGFMQGLKQKLGPGVDVRMKLVEWNR